MNYNFIIINNIIFITLTSKNYHSIFCRHRKCFLNCLLSIRYNINIRLILSSLLFAGGLAGFYFLYEQPTVVRVLVLLGATGLAAQVFSKTLQGQEIIEFINNAVTEGKKVVWPTRRETFQMTLIVIILVTIMAIFLGFVDVGFSYIINLLLGRG